jgi:hypothetical protein
VMYMEPIHDFGAACCLCGVAALVIGLVSGCPPTPVTPVDASDAATTPCTAACANLQALGCPEGSQPDCVTMLAHIDGARAIRTPSGAPLTCAAIAVAQTASDVQALGIGCGR